MARGGFRALQLFRPLAALLPSVRRAERAAPFRERVLYTGMSVSVFLVCSHLPLYGVRYSAAGAGADPFHLVRSILASNRGTLMELGVAPVVTAGMVMQLLTGSGLLRADSNVREDRELLDTVHKVLGAVIALGEATAYVLLGMYGSVAQLGMPNAVLIILQLFSASLLVVFLDDLFQKGFGLQGTSAISLLAATNTCEKIAWQTFSPVTLDTGRGAEFEGLALAVVHHVVARPDKARALVQTLFRRHLPNVINLLATCMVFLVAVFLEGLRVVLPLRSRDTRGRQSTFPIKLLYTSTMPIVLHSAAVSSLYLLSRQLYYSRYGGSLLVRLLGSWKETASYGAAIPVGGLSHYATPPSSLLHAAADPLHALLYAALLLTSCALLSRAWSEVSGSSARDVARRLRDQRLFIPGVREDRLHTQLNRYIPTAAALGGLCIGALTILADVTGAIGSATGILSAATVVFNLVDTFQEAHR